MNKSGNSSPSRIFHGIGAFVALIAAAALLGSGTPQRKARAPHAIRHTGREWPYSFPCRIHEGANRDLFVMTLGDVKTPLAQGTFNPLKDEVTLNDGKVIKNYYRDSLGIKFYKPINKKYFPLPPSGWCSWYYYYQTLDAKQIELNAKWIAKNLKAYGARYVQIDDGWQGKGHGAGDNRNWFKVNDRFAPGMDALAAYIKKLGLTPGIWLAPQGQSSPTVVKDNPGAFILNADTSVSKTWEGMYLVDPSSRAGLNYLKKLFTMLKGWGYDYFKIDGQPVVLDQYRRKERFMAHPSDNTDSLYRATIGTIRKTIGSRRYLLGCWGIPLPGIGIMNGSRTGGDVVLGWSGFMTSLMSTMHWYFLNNVAWYCDPDAMLLRYPLTIGQARAWATLQGLTGEALMASDRLPDLSAGRVSILKSVFPAQDIRPLDLFPSKTLKHIWDLKINHLGRNYDVVGLFDFNKTKSKTMFLKWKDLGYSDTSLIQVFDFWNKEYLGAWRKGMAVTISPTSCRVLTLLKSNGQIQLISTNRHITQGYPDLVSLKSNVDGTKFHGESKVIAGAPYALYFAFPRGRDFVVRKATAGNLKVKVTDHQGWARVEFTSPKTTAVRWNVSFSPTSYYHYPVSTPYGLKVRNDGLDGVMVGWDDQYNLNLGCDVYLNGRLAGYAPTNVFPLTGLNPDSAYHVAVRSVWEDGIESKGADTTNFVVRNLLPEKIDLSRLHPANGGFFSENSSLTGSALSIHGTRYESGIGTRANSELLFNVHGLYKKFTAVAGLDDNNTSKKGSVEFQVFGDGRLLWQSGPMTHEGAAVKASVDIGGVKDLLLKVKNVGQETNDFVDWVNARLDGLIK